MNADVDGQLFQRAEHRRGVSEKRRARDHPLVPARIGDRVPEELDVLERSDESVPERHGLQDALRGLDPVTTAHQHPASEEHVHDSEHAGRAQLAPGAPLIAGELVPRHAYERRGHVC